MLNHYLSENVKLIEMSKLNNLINIITISLTPGLIVFFNKWGPTRGGRGSDLHVFHNSPLSERVWKSRSATRMMNGQPTGPRVARIGTGSCSSDIPSSFFGPKTRKINHSPVNLVQNLKISIESTSPANKNKKKEPELPTNPTSKSKLFQ
jgi:hypothetical protein